MHRRRWRRRMDDCKQMKLNMLAINNLRRCTSVGKDLDDEIVYEDEYYDDEGKEKSKTEEREVLIFRQGNLCQEA
jgi:hypothetical protein